MTKAKTENKAAEVAVEVPAAAETVTAEAEVEEQAAAAPASEPTRKELEATIEKYKGEEVKMALVTPFSLVNPSTTFRFHQNSEVMQKVDKWVGAQVLAGLIKLYV